MLRFVRRALYAVLALTVIGVILTPDDEQGNAATGETTTTEADAVPASDACLDALREAHNVDPMRDTHADMYPALTACTTLEGYAYATQKYPDAFDARSSPELQVVTMCLTWPEEVTAGAPLCDTVEVSRERRLQLLSEE